MKSFRQNLLKLLGISALIAMFASVLSASDAHAGGGLDGGRFLESVFYSNEFAKQKERDDRGQSIP
ncbi:MAG: hypothetical protein K8F91_21515, partial [Candidatus Obscuribacterales bacterium]|nr:hypothetical protein [Candidatus Obscuribacterales bacterium]